MSSFTVPGQRKPSPACEAFVKTKEQCRLKAFLPTPRDKPTIGWGATARVKPRAMLCSAVVFFVEFMAKYPASSLTMPDKLFTVGPNRLNRPGRLLLMPV